MTERLTPRSALLIAAAFLFLTALGWFFLISPKRAESARLESRIDETRGAIGRLRAEQAAAGKEAKLTDLFRLTKAMPSKVDVPGILLELNRLAGDSGASFTSVTPLVPVPQASYTALPAQVVFEGTFFQLTGLLQRLRTRVSLKGGVLSVRGRLYTIDAIDLSEGESKFPHLKATLTLGAFLYNGGPGAAAAVAPATSSGGQPVAAGPTR